LHLGPHPATAYFARANHRDLFLHQFNQPDTAIGLAFGGKRSLRCEEALAGQSPIVISHQFHDGIIPLPRPRFKPFLRTLGRRDEYTRNIASPPPPANLPSKRWRDLILRVWQVDPRRCQSHLVGTSIHPSSFILHPFRQASSGSVCPGIALLLAHCLAARPLPPACGLGDGAKPPEHRQNLPVAALHQPWQDGAAMNESEQQFSFTRAASSTSGRAKNQIPIIHKQSLVCFPSPLFYARPAASSRKRHGPELRF
jgi:hypothetical protein